MDIIIKQQPYGLFKQSFELHKVKLEKHIYIIEILGQDACDEYKSIQACVKITLATKTRTVPKSCANLSAEKRLKHKCKKRLKEKFIFITKYSLRTEN